MSDTDQRTVDDVLGADVSALRPLTSADIGRGAWVLAISHDRIHVGRAVAYGNVAVTVGEQTFTPSDRFYEIAPLVDEHQPSWVRRTFFGERASRVEFSPTLREAIDITASVEPITHAHTGQRIVIESDYEARLVLVTAVTRSSFGDDDLVVTYEDDTLFDEAVERRTTFPRGTIAECSR